MAVKCPKCGGELVQTTPEIAKCKKCGMAFKRKGTVEQSIGVEKNQKKAKKKGGGCLKVILIIFIILIALGVIGVMFGEKPKEVDSGNTNMDESRQGEQKESSKSDTFTIGETAELNNVQVTMTDYKESNGSEWNAPSDGNVFVLVEFEIANNSNEELAISSALSFEAYADDYALNYALNAMLDNEQTQLDGSIAAGKKMRGWIGYEVPSNWGNLEIHFTDNVWSSNKFKFEITK